MAEKKFYPGQTVVLRSSGRSSTDREVKVVKVGRTLVHVSVWGGDRTAAFRMDTGYSNEEHGYSRILTFDEVEALRHRNAVQEQIQAAEPRLRLREVNFLSTEGLEELLGLLVRDRGRRES